MNFKLIINSSLCLAALLVNPAAQATVLFELGTGELSPAEGQGLSTITLTGLGDEGITAANSTDSSSGLNGMNSTIASGTFITTSTGGSSGVTFDITFTSISGNFNSQGGALGVTGGSANAAIDNNGGTGPQEAITFSISNIMGLAVGETLAFTAIDISFGSGAGETFTLDGGPDRLFSDTGTAGGSPPIDADETIDFSAAPLQTVTIGTGSTGNSSFAINNFSVSVVDPATVVPEPSSTLLLGLGGLGLLARRNRRA